MVFPPLFANRYRNFSLTCPNRNRFSCFRSFTQLKEQHPVGRYGFLGGLLARNEDTENVQGSTSTSLKFDPVLFTVVRLKATRHRPDCGVESRRNILIAINCKKRIERRGVLRFQTSALWLSLQRVKSEREEGNYN